jgi:hypothetical protein
MVMLKSRDFTIDWPFPRVEPRLLFIEIHPAMGKRWREVTCDCVLRIRANDSSGILVVMRPVDILDERPDVGFISRRLDSQGCD